MEASEKIKQLIGDRNRAKIARRASIGVTTLDGIVNQERKPRVHTAIKLARELNVPVDWLFNDSADWPPPNYESETAVGAGFCEKIRRLMHGRSRAQLCRDAGLPESMLDSLINKKQRPGVTRAIMLARALEVPVDWLFDDSQPWPPPVTDDGASDSRIHQLEKRIDLLFHLVAESKGAQ